MLIIGIGVGIVVYGVIGQFLFMRAIEYMDYVHRPWIGTDIFRADLFSTPEGKTRRKAALIFYTAGGIPLMILLLVHACSIV